MSTSEITLCVGFLYDELLLPNINKTNKQITLYGTEKTQQTTTYV